jgi:hypothetical protein
VSTSDKGQAMMERKALERLVSALMDEEYAGSRGEAVRDALAMSLIALWGEGELDEDDLQASLEEMSVQLMIGKLERDGLSVHRTLVNIINDDDTTDEAQVLATNNPIVASIIEHTMEQAFKPMGPYDLN